MLWSVPLRKQGRFYELGLCPSKYLERAKLQRDYPIRILDYLLKHICYLYLAFLRIFDTVWTNLHTLGALAALYGEIFSFVLNSMRPKVENFDPPRHES